MVSPLSIEDGSYTCSSFNVELAMEWNGFDDFDPAIFAAERVEVRVIRDQHEFSAFPSVNRFPRWAGRIFAERGRDKNVGV